MTTPGPTWPAGVDESDAVVGVLARALRDDPMYAWLFPDPASREDLLRQWLQPVTRWYAQAPGKGCTAVGERPRVAGGLLWESVGVPSGATGDPAPPDRRAQLLGLIGEDGNRKWAALLRSTMHRPRHPHLYLYQMGVDPAAQGRGLGRLLVAAAMAEGTRLGVPVFLESTSPANHAFYDQVGFTRRGTATIGAGGPEMTLFDWSPAQASEPNRSLV